MHRQYLLLVAIMSAASADFTCTIPGMFPDPDACLNFIQCVPGMPGDPLIKYVTSCAPGTLFDDISFVCNFEHQVDCGCRPRPDGSIDADHGQCGVERNPRELLHEMQPVMETYWESDDSWPFEPGYGLCTPPFNDPQYVNTNAYGYDFGALPVATATTPGVNVVNIAFASANGEYCTYEDPCDSFVCGLHLFRGADEARFEKLQNDIASLQSQGALVKLAYGGEEWGNIKPTENSSPAVLNLVKSIVDAVNLLGVDGVDLAQRDGCGKYNMWCQDQSSTHLAVLQKLRQAMPNKIISYTFPETADDYPYYDIVRYGANYVDYFTIYRAEMEDIQYAVNLGVPKNKLSWGVAIGCTNKWSYLSDVDTNVTVTEAQDIAKEVKASGMSGVATWSLNRDTDHRIPSGPGCTNVATGLPDGTYLNAIYAELN